MAEYPEPSWDDMMEDTERAVKALDNLYDRCLRQAATIRNGGGNLRELESLLNKTIPATEEDRRLAFAMAFLARIKRGSLIEYLFKIRRACLLLLIDGPATVTALNVENCLDIWTGEDGLFRVARLSEGGRPRETPAARDGEEPRRRNRGRRNRGRGGDDGNRDGGNRDGEGRDGGGRDGGGRSRAGGRAAPRGAVTGKPVMDMEECHQVLAALGDPEPAQTVPGETAPTAVDESSYLAAVIRGNKPAAPQTAKAATEAPAKAATEAPAKASSKSSSRASSKAAAGATAIPPRPEEKPATAEEKPATAEEKPATAEEKPATAEEKPATAEEKPATAEEKPAMAGEKPAKGPLPPSGSSGPASKKPLSMSWADMCDDEDELSTPPAAAVNPAESRRGDEKRAPRGGRGGRGGH